MIFKINVVKAIKTIANKTPFALWSWFFLIKIKKTNKFGIAAIDNTLPYKFPSAIICKVSEKLNLEKYSTYKKKPPAVANKATKTPINISFFTVPKRLIFESYDVQLNQIEQVQ